MRLAETTVNKQSRLVAVMGRRARQTGSALSAAWLTIRYAGFQGSDFAPRGQDLGMARSQRRKQLASRLADALF